MENIIKLIILIIIISTGKTTFSQKQIHYKNWNDVVLKKLKKEYNEYKKTYQDTCWDKDRDLSFDYYRKYIVIDEFKFQKQIDKLLKKIKGTEFDSIVSVNIFDPQKDEIDFPSFETSLIIL